MPGVPANKGCRTCLLGESNSDDFVRVGDAVPTRARQEMQHLRVPANKRRRTCLLEKSISSHVGNAFPHGFDPNSCERGCLRLRDRSSETDLPPSSGK